MIILAKAVAYGGNAARYAMEKEGATVVKVNHMPDNLDATEIWYRMKHHCQLHQQDRTVGRKLTRFMTTFVISPSKEESENYTLDDWANLADEGLEALDSVGLLPKGFKEKVKTNFRNSMNVLPCIGIPSLEPFTCILTVAVWIMTARPMMFTMFISGQ